MYTYLSLQEKAHEKILLKSTLFLTPLANIAGENYSDHSIYQPTKTTNAYLPPSIFEIFKFTNPSLDYMLKCYSLNR